MRMYLNEPDSFNMERCFVSQIDNGVFDLSHNIVLGSGNRIDEPRNYVYGMRPYTTRPIAFSMATISC